MLLFSSQYSSFPCITAFSLFSNFDPLHTWNQAMIRVGGATICFIHIDLSPAISCQSLVAFGKHWSLNSWTWSFWWPKNTSVQPSRGGRMIQKLGYLFTVIHLHTGADKRMFRSNCYTRLMYPINGPKTEDNNLSVKSTEKSKTQLRPNHSE
jgi:hypothetical protein